VPLATVVVGVLVHAVLHGWLLGAGAVLFPDQHWL